MKKLLLATTMLSFLSLSSVSGANAAEPVNHSDLEDSSIISPYAVDYSGYEYVHSSSYKDRTTEFQHRAKNESSLPDSVTYSVAVTQSSTSTGSTSATFKAMVAEAGLANQVGLGTTTTKTISCTWAIPPKSEWRLYAGSEWVSVSGTERLWSNGKIISSKTVTGKWTWESWSDKSPI